MCQKNSGKSSAESLTYLTRLDQSFTQVYQLRIKFIETVYNPLWSARLKTRDTFSENLRAEGEMLYGRYHHEAQVYFESAKREAKTLRKLFAQLANAMKSSQQACPTEGFQNCVENDQPNLINHLKGLKKTLREQESLLRKLSHQAVVSISENPSEHYAFPDRYREGLDVYMYRIYPEYLRISRALREFMDYDSAVECCLQCTPAALGVTQDAVIQQTRPSGQGAIGVSGKIVNNASLVGAFERLKSEEKKS